MKKPTNQQTKEATRAALDAITLLGELQQEGKNSEEAVLFIVTDVDQENKRNLHVAHGGTGIAGLSEVIYHAMSRDKKLAVAIQSAYLLYSVLEDGKPCDDTPCDCPECKEAIPDDFKQKSEN